MGPDTALATYTHPVLGLCDLIRIEGINWIIRSNADGRLHRIPPGMRGPFRRIYNDEQAAAPQMIAPVAMTVSGSPTSDVLATIEHPDFGVGDVLRIDVADWIVRFRSTGRTQRFTQLARRRVKVVADFTPTGRFGGIKSITTNGNLSPAAPDSVNSKIKTVTTQTADPFAKPSNVNRGDVHQAATSSEVVISDPSVNLGRRQSLRLIESLRSGLPPSDAFRLGLCIGQSELSTIAQSILLGTERGGIASVIRGSYGQGKSFALKQVMECGEKEGFAVAHAEIDATENRLNHPARIYHSLLSNLRVGGEPTSGIAAIRRIIAKAQDQLGVGSNSHDASMVRRLDDVIQCEPLSWLLTDPDLLDKQLLFDLCMAQPGVVAAVARREHRYECKPQTWPAFNSSTQGDFASYLLSGWGRVCRAAGYKGLLLVLDEMEKWEDLNWHQQTQAGNLLGGLIWSATAVGNDRYTSAMPSALIHSARAGGFRFNTRDRCNIGIVIAMTPRGQGGPENEWANFGRLEIAELPTPSKRGLCEFCHKLAPFYCSAQSIPELAAGTVSELADAATRAWECRGDRTMRSGMLSVIEAFDALLLAPA